MDLFPFPSVKDRNTLRQADRFRDVVIGSLLLLTIWKPSLASDVECKDHWNTQSQWHAMSALCETGASRGDPLSQVAVAINLLNEGGSASKVKAEELLRSAAAKGYDDAYYWLGSIQKDRSKAVSYLEMAVGSGGMGLMALAVAADAHFKGTGVPKDFQKARAVYRRAFEAMVDNGNKGIPKPPGEWWSNAKWFVGQNAVIQYAERYGFQMKTDDGKVVVVEVEPHPEFSDKELSDRRWKKISGAK